MKILVKIPENIISKIWLLPNDNKHSLAAFDVWRFVLKRFQPHIQPNKYPAKCLIQLSTENTLISQLNQVLDVCRIKDTNTFYQTCYEDSVIKNRNKIK